MSATGNSRRAELASARAGTPSGFTLLEILVVVFLIALISGVFATTLGGGFGVHLKHAGRTLSAELEYVGQRAVTTGRPQRFVVDLDQQVFRVEELPTPPETEAGARLPEHAERLSLAPPLEAREFVPVDGRLGEWRSLDDRDEILIRELRLADEAKTDGAVAIGFSPDGASDPAELWLRDDGGYDLRIRLVPWSGEIRVEEVDSDAP
jgi:prepilin-type N-terminal cleavage/methylation domain-containing protein